MSTAPVLYSVASKSVPTDCGTPGTTYQVVNYSNSDTVWISDNPTVQTNVGLPIQPQSSVLVSFPRLYAVLDAAAINPVTLIVGSSINGWSPSPVKVVNISGPVSVTGDVGIDGTVDVTGTVDIGAGTVDIGTVSGTVDIIAPGGVDISNTPDVIPVTSLDHVLVNSVFVPGPWLQNIPDLNKYNSLILVVQFDPDPSLFDYTTYNSIECNGTFNGVGLFRQWYVQQGSTGWDNTTHTGQLSHGTLTYITIPLNGIDSISLNGNLVPAGTTSMILDAWATTAQLTPTNRMQSPNAGLGTGNTTAPWWFNPGARLAIANGTSLFVPLPTTSNPITMTLYSSNTGTGTTKSTVTIVDSITNVLRTFVDLDIPKGTFLDPIVLPNTAQPQYLQIDESGGTGVTSRWEILIEENILGLPA